MNKINFKTLLTLAFLFVFTALPAIAEDLGSELQLKKNSGPTYKETVEFINNYPKYTDRNGYFTRSNLRVDDCIVKFDWTQNRRGEFYSMNTDDKSGTSSFDMRQVKYIDKDFQTCIGHNAICLHYKDKRFWKLFFMEMDDQYSFASAFEHLQKFCPSNDKPSLF
jgi:hypothetical protein